MITLTWLYTLAGAMFAAFALLSAADRSNPKVPGSIRFLGPTMALDGTMETPAQLAAANKIEEI